MYPGKFDIKQYQGATMDFPIWYRASGVLVDLAGYSAKMQLRSRIDSATVVLELSTQNGRILLGDDVTSEATSSGDLANIQLLVSATTMKDIIVGQYVYDIDLTDPVAYNIPILYGSFILTGEVTR